MNHIPNCGISQSQLTSSCSKVKSDINKEIKESKPKYIRQCSSHGKLPLAQRRRVTWRTYAWETIQSLPGHYANKS
ncbi:hypothetical protein R6Q59_016132 [Mikania micrantha]